VSALRYQYLWSMYHLCECLSGLQILLNLMEDLTKKKLTIPDDPSCSILCSKSPNATLGRTFEATNFNGVDTWITLLIIILAFIQVLYRFMKRVICVILLDIFRILVALNCSQGEYFWLYGFLKIPTDRCQSADVCLSSRLCRL